MPHKGKIDVEGKIAAVKEYLSGETSIKKCAVKYGVSESTISSWLRLYENRGFEGLTPVSKTRKYSPLLKQNAVKDYLSGKSSQIEICKKYDISSRAMLQS